MKVLLLFLFEFVLFLTVRGFREELQNCDFEKCQDNDLSDSLMEVRFMPNDEQLREMCPSALQFVNCIIEEAETCLGKTVEEMERSPVPTFGKILSGGRSLAQDMCDENSQFRQDYLENRQCFRGFIMAGSRLCRKEGVNIADIIMGPSDDKDEDEDEETRECLIGTYEVSCLIMELEDTCGETAQKMFVDVMSRLKGMSLSICDNKDTAAAIRSKLFDYMELEGGVRSKLDIALNRLIKRR